MTYKKDKEGIYDWFVKAIVRHKHAVGIRLVLLMLQQQVPTPDNI